MYVRVTYMSHGVLATEHEALPRFHSKLICKHLPTTQPNLSIIYSMKAYGSIVCVTATGEPSTMSNISLGQFGIYILTSFAGLQQQIISQKVIRRAYANPTLIAEYFIVIFSFSPPYSFRICWWSRSKAR